MEKVILPAFRSNVPEVPEGITKPGWHLPLYRMTEDGIDLDFGPLLLFEKAIIDQNNYDFINSSDKTYLKPLKESLRILKEEGFLDLLDFNKYLNICREPAIIQTEKALYNPFEWTGGILKSLKGWEKQLPSFRRVLEKDYDESSMHMEFGTFVYLMKRDGKIIKSEEDRLMKLMASNKKRYRSSEIDELKEIVRPTLSYLYTNIGISEILGIPFVDVDFSSELYSKVYQRSMRHLSPDVEKPSKEVEIATQLFNIAIPHLRPKNPKEMLSLLKDKRIKDFREYVSSVSNEGLIVDPQIIDELIIQAIRVERTIQKKTGIVKWLGRAVSLAPFATPVVIAGEEIADKIFTGKKKKFNWLYALIDNTI